MSSEKCPECGNTYKQIGHHWSQSSCNPPKLTEEQKDIIRGLLMGDGYLQNHDKERKCCVRVEMITEEYLEWVDDKFGILGRGVRLDKTAEENARKGRETGHRPDADSEDYSDVYGWESRSLDELEIFADWYTAEGKTFPEKIDLTPTVLKHWYCGDGHYNNGSHIKISVANERGNKTKINNYFSSAALPTPSRYEETEIEGGGKRYSLYFMVSDSQELFEYMGSAPPGFEYKWP